MRHVKHDCVYIMTGKRMGTLFMGVTSNLPARVHAHREGLIKGLG